MNRFSLRTALFALFLIFSCQALADDPQPAPIDEAFQFSVSTNDTNLIHLHWTIAPDYYLYKDRFSFTLLEPRDAYLGSIKLPEGFLQQDEILGDHVVFEGSLDIDVPVENAEGKTVRLNVGYQGCSKNGFCYPPQVKHVQSDLSSIAPTTNISAAETPATRPLSEQDAVTRLLSNKSLWLVLSSFFVFGLLLSFTPCVLPMIPILSGIIIGHGETVSTRKAFWLSFAYVMGMAITYAIAGILFGWIGGSIQAAFQAPWVIALFSLLFLLLALSLFDLYEIRLPSQLQAQVSLLSNHQRSGSYWGAAIMGCLSTLIVSPCVSAPLVGALAYISNTGNSVLGGLALFAMGLGMGVPLLLIGISGGKLLPKAGAWMNTIKAFFGVLLLAVAIWMISRIIPETITLMLWAALLIISAVYMGLLNPNIQTGWGKFWKGLGLLMSIYGILLLVGASMGNTDPLQPLTSLHAADRKTQATLAFQPINGVADLKKTLAKKTNKITLLDFYADWCVACKEMEKYTFSDPRVQARLNEMNLLQADVTKNDNADKTLQAYLHVVAPPTLVFFDPEGNEIKALRIVGSVGPDELLERLSH